MRKLFLTLAALGCCATTTGSTLLTTIAGHYDSSFIVEMPGVDGATFRDRVDDVLEIVPLSKNAAYVRVDLIDGAENSCDIAGVAVLENKSLVYRDPSEPAAGDARCVLTITKFGKSLKVSDGADYGCSRMYCGERGQMDGSFTLSGRRPIHYMARLKASSEYRRALNEWRSSKKSPEN